MASLAGVRLAGANEPARRLAPACLRFMCFSTAQAAAHELAVAAGAAAGGSCQ